MALYNKREIKDTTHKECRTCKAVLDRMCFYENAANSDGLDWHCRECRRIQRQLKRSYFSKKSLEWNINNREARREIARRCSRKRRELQSGFTSVFNKEQQKACYSKFKNRCFNCFSTLRLSIDHHKPLSKGFPLQADNAVILCNICNSRKNTKMPIRFYSINQLIQLTLLGIKNFI